MKYLRFAWDHPAMTALCATSLVMLIGVALMMPWFWLVLAVLGLSIRKGWINSEREDNEFTQAAKASVEARRAYLQALRDSAEPYRQAGEKILTATPRPD